MKEHISRHQNLSERRMDDKPEVSLLMDSEPEYTREFGAAYHGDSSDLLEELPANSIDLILTSPPFDLQHQKSYGSDWAQNGDSYNDWFVEGFAEDIKRVLQPHGSCVIEIGGAFKDGTPERSTYQFELLPRLTNEVGLHLAQDFYWFNPAQPPGPTEWVNKRKIRSTDAVTHIWWLSKEINNDPAYTDEIKIKIDIIERLQNKNTISVSEKVEIAEAILVGENEESDVTQLEDISGIGESHAEKIRDAGYETLAEAENAPKDDLLGVNGIGPKLASKIKGEANRKDNPYTKEVKQLIEESAPELSEEIKAIVSASNKAPAEFAARVYSSIRNNEQIPRPRPKPEANNQRSLSEYSESHQKLISTGQYNTGERPSGRTPGSKSYVKDNGGAIQKNMLEQAGPTSLVDSFVSALESVQNPKEKIESIIDDPVDALKDFGSLIRASNTASNTPYLERCKEAGVEPHPARFPKQIPEHFIEFLTPGPERYPWDRGRFNRPVVLDIFAGSNLTGSVAEERGRYWLAFEKDQDYVENSKLRFLDE